MHLVFFSSNKLPRFITMEIKLHSELHLNSVLSKASSSAAHERAITFEYVLFALCGNYAKAYFVSMVKLTEVSSLHTRWISIWETSSCLLPAKK